MKPQDTTRLIKEADELLSGALEEMNRAQEDVAAYRVCHNSRQALSQYLEAFLINNNIAIQAPATIDSLLEQCRNYDGRFNLIDITPIDCRTHTDDTDYCLRVDKVEECLQIAKQTRGIVTDNVPSY